MLPDKLIIDKIGFNLKDWLFVVIVLKDVRRIKIKIFFD
jgi:hypothetical protein